MAKYRLREVIYCDYVYAGRGPQDVEIKMECGHWNVLVERSDRKYPGDWMGEKSRCYECAKQE